MASEIKDGTRVPPYVSFRTFQSFIDGLREHGVPGRIDRSLMQHLSGSNQSQLLSALQYLGLIDEHGVSAQRLQALVNASDDDRPGALADVLRESYPTLLAATDFSLTNATQLQFNEKIKGLGATGDTVRKCGAFFLQAVKAADLSVSPRLTTSKSTTPRRPPARRSTRKTDQNDNLSTQAQGDAASSQQGNIGTVSGASWQEMLLEKFPAFDPTWPDDVKTKWFDAFDKLMDRGSRLDQ